MLFVFVIKFDGKKNINTESSRGIFLNWFYRQLTVEVWFIIVVLRLAKNIKNTDQQAGYFIVSESFLISI